MNMFVKSRRCAFVVIISLALPTYAIAEPASTNWPSFRGPGASGVAEGYKLPVKWNVETGENIKWKTPIPGLAHSSPIVWGDRVFVTSAVSEEAHPYLRVGLYGASPDHPEQIVHDFRVYCLEAKSGKIIWEQSAHKGIPKVKRHIKATHANCTPATDGKHLVAFFGSQGLYCDDIDGKLLWKKDLGVFDAGPPRAGDLQWGFSSSPIIHDGRVIVLCAARNESFLAAYDVQSGSEIWRTPRVKYPGWGTPTVAVHRGASGAVVRSQVITNGFKHIGGYDFKTGKELWRMRGGGDIPVPTPIVSGTLIFITNAHGGQAPVYAIRSMAEGDITLGDGEKFSTYIAWSHMKIGNYMQTPLVYGDYLYCCRDSGIMACYDAVTGKKQYRKRLAGGVGFTASPVAGDGKIYFTSEEGDVFVIKAGTEYELLGKNTMGEISMATPAISEGTIFFRTQHHVVSVGE